MARVFTITAGVENMGALKSGGQGSVYKGKKTGEIITAIKILPTPIYSESGDDKNFVSFENEVQKLKKVNEDINPNVVTILSSGITDSGNFPYIEMEYIDGPDLAELLNPPHAPVFTIQETLKVAQQLSNALAHCHKADVKHGDIKSNNVKFNIHSGNYVLLDFGLSVMSDEQRRTSLRRAGAIEFMAPEQHEGHLLFETEVYSFGVILFELLSGTVPFSLRDNGESARNTVLVAHLEEMPPNLLALRQQHLPEWWSKEKKAYEMQVPEWLVSLIYKCLEKKPADRFSNGMELHDHIVRNSISAAGNTGWGADRIAKLEQENDQLKKEKAALEKKLAEQEKLNSTFNENNPAVLNNQTALRPKFSKAKNIVIGLLSLALLGFLANLFLNNKGNEQPGENEKTNEASNTSTSEEQIFQLKRARDLVVNGRVEQAKVIYKSLAKQDVSEAMYEYGNITLLNENNKADCNEAWAYLDRAAVKGYVPAKRTTGFLYAFAGDSIVLNQKGYQDCSFTYNIPKGSKLLMEANLMGDSVAGILLDELNLKFGSN